MASPHFSVTRQCVSLTQRLPKARLCCSLRSRGLMNVCTAHLSKVFFDLMVLRVIRLKVLDTCSSGFL